MLIAAFIGTLIWGRLRTVITNYVTNYNFGSNKAKAAKSNTDCSDAEGNENGGKSGMNSDIEKKLEEKMKKIEEAHEEQRRIENEKKEEERKIKLNRKRAKYEKQVRKKYDLMMGVYEKWKNDRIAKFDELNRELTKILWSQEVHSNLSARLEFAKEAHSYAFGMCDEINSDIHDKSKDIDPEKRHAKLVVKITILMENFAREFEIAESEYGDMSRLVKVFQEAMYLSRIHNASPRVSEEILSSWEEFKKIFDEFDNDVDNDGPKLDEIGRVVSQRLAVMAFMAAHPSLVQNAIPTLTTDQQPEGTIVVESATPSLKTASSAKSSNDVTGRKENVHSSAGSGNTPSSQTPNTEKKKNKNK